jgi:hypothetical protein
MASVIYPRWKQSIMVGDANSVINTSVTNVAGLLVSSSYTYASTDQYRNIIPTNTLGSNISPAIVNPTLSGTLNVSVTPGALDTSDASLTFPSVVNGSPTYGSSADRVVLHIITGNPATERLVAVIDLPTTVTYTGGNVVVTWSTSPNYIFQL